MTEQTETSTPAHGKLWSLLDWSFWGAGMGDIFRESMADTMLAAVPAETVAQAEEIMAAFIERRKIEKTGVTVYQEQRAELDAVRAQLAEMTRHRDNAVRALAREDVDLDIANLPDLIGDGLSTGNWTWPNEPEDTCPQRLIDDVVGIVRPVIAGVTEQRDQARAELAAAKERHKEGLRRADEQLREMNAELQRYADGRETPVLWSVYNAMHLRAANAEAQAKQLATAQTTLDHVQEIVRRLTAHTVGFQDVLDDSDRDPWARTVGADIAALKDALASSGGRLALPWAHTMPDDDLHGFLNDLVSAAIDRWRSDPDVPDRDILANIEKVCADWRTPGQGYRSDEDETGDGR